MHACKELAWGQREIHLKGLNNAHCTKRASQVTLVVKTPPANAGDLRDAGSIPGSGRSPGGAHGNPLQYSCLENIMDRGAWRATVHRVVRSWTWLKWLGVFYSIAKVPFRTDVLWLQAMLHAWEFLEPSTCAHWKRLLGGRDEDNHHARFLTGDAGEQIA